MLWLRSLVSRTVMRMPETATRLSAICRASSMVSRSPCESPRPILPARRRSARESSQSPLGTLR